MPFPLLQESCGRIWNKLQGEKKHKSSNVLLALWIVCSLTTFFPSLSFFCRPSLFSSWLNSLISRGNMTCFSKGCLPWGQPWGQTEKPWFELTIFIPALNSFEWTLLKPQAINRGNGWKYHRRSYVKWRRRELFISLSCTRSREVLLWQYFNAPLAICAGILQIHE